MIKRYAALSLAIIMALSLCACKKEKSSFGDELKSSPEVYTAAYYAPAVKMSDDEMFSYINQMDDLINRIATSGCDASTVEALSATADMLRSYRYEENSLAPLMGCCGDIIKKVLNMKYRIYALPEIYSLFDQYTSLMGQIPSQYVEGAKTLSRQTLNMAMLASYLAGQADYDQVALTLAGGISFTSRKSGKSFDQVWASIGKFPGYPLQNMQPVFFSDTYTAVACNTVITDNDLTKKVTDFNRATSEYINIFKDQSINCIVIETPHMYDFGDDGKLLTQNLIISNEMTALPSGLAFDACNTVGDAGILVISADFTGKETDQDAINALLNTIAYCKSNGRLIALYLSWDTSKGVTKSQKVLAHTLSSSGADIIIGLSDGELQGVENIDGRYIFYNIGQLVNGNNSDLSARRSMAVRIVAGKSDNGNTSQIKSVTAIPFYHYSNDGKSNNFQPTPIFEAELQETIEAIISKSRNYDNGVTSLDYFNTIG